MYNFFDKLKIKSNAKKVRSELWDGWINLETTLEWMTSHIDKSIYFPKNTDFTLARIARSCVGNLKLGKDSKPIPFYILTYKSTDSSVRNYFDVTTDCIELIEYLKDENRFFEGVEQNETTTPKELIKKYCIVCGEVLLNIQKLTQDNSIIVGGTFDLNLAKKYVNFVFSENMSDEEFENACNVVNTETVIRNIASKNYYILSNVQEYLYLFKLRSMYWKIFKHQIQFGTPILKEALELIKGRSYLQENLKDGDFLDGLDFGNKIQMETIKMAIELKDLYRYLCSSASVGDELKSLENMYIDELKTENGWLNSEKITAKYEEYKTLCKENEKAFEEMRKHHEETMKWAEEFLSGEQTLNTARELVEGDNIEDDNTLNAQERAAYQEQASICRNVDYHLEAERRQERAMKKALLEAQITQLETQLSLLKGQYYATSSYSERYNINSQMINIKSEISRLRSKTYFL